MDKKRKHVRYKPSHLEYAMLMFDGEADHWIPDVVGLIVDESAVAGGQIVIATTSKLNIGKKVKLKLGDLDPVVGEVAWLKNIDLDLLRVGIKFTE